MALVSQPLQGILYRFAAVTDGIGEEIVRDVYALTGQEAVGVAATYGGLSRTRGDLKSVLGRDVTQVKLGRVFCGLERDGYVCFYQNVLFEVSTGAYMVFQFEEYRARDTAIPKTLVDIKRANPRLVVEQSLPNWDGSSVPGEEA